MKVLFLQNLEHHNVGDIKDIPDGYARNFLLKKGIAVAATEEQISLLSAKIDKIKKDEEKIISDLNILKEKIEKMTLEVRVQAGDEGKLFGAVTNRDVSEALAKNKVNVDKHDIEILEPIHELGNHVALAKLGHGIHANININVVREG